MRTLMSHATIAQLVAQENEYQRTYTEAFTEGIPAEAFVVDDEDIRTHPISHLSALQKTIATYKRDHPRHGGWTR